MTTTMTKEKITCRNYCNKWNDIDRDCEIYGQQHPCPRKCPFYKNGLHKENTVLFDENYTITTCDICGKEIVGIENFINAGDKVVCSERCKQKAIAEFRHWQETESHNWRKP